MLGYDDTNKLVEYSIQAELTEDQYLKFITKPSFTMLKLEAWAAKSKTLEVIEIFGEPTFDEFYEKYKNKIGRKDALKNWNRMSKPEQLKAFIHIDQYDKELRATPGIAKLYPATYLNKLRWNDK